MQSPAFPTSTPKLIRAYCFCNNLRRYVRDDIKQTNTAVVFLLLLSILYRYYQCSTLPFPRSYFVT